MPPPAALVRFLRLTAPTRRMSLEAASLLALSRVLVLFVPMRHWRTRLDTAEPSRQIARPDADVDAAARAIAHIVTRVAPHLPFDATCLCQAIAAQWMLRRRHVGTQLCLGVRRHRDRSVALHAWLIVNDRCVVGGPNVDRYTPLSTFPRTRGHLRGP